MKALPAAALLLALGFAVPVSARVDLLLLPPPDTEPLGPRPEFTLHLNNPTEYDDVAILEGEIIGEYADPAGHFRVRLELAEQAHRRVAVPRMSRRTVRLRPVADLRSRGEFISFRLRQPSTNAIMFRPAPPDPPVAAAPAPAVSRRGLGHRNIDLTSDLEHMRRHISGYDPIYFAAGGRDRFNARFQFSFKYRPLDPGPDAWMDAPWRTLLGKVHFAYTQTSIWDLESLSKPFYDSSYQPALFLLHTLPSRAGSPGTVSFEAGAKHESNGKGGGSAPSPARPGLISPTGGARHPSDTRSLNTLYVQPRLRWENGGDHFLEAALRAHAYFQIDENPDIARYRGYAELTLRGGFVRGLQLSAQLRGRAGGHGSVEFNLTWPTSESPLLRAFPLLGTLGGYAQLQYFNGYGESLLDYDVRRRDQLRFGLMIVR